jgi:hypothetical protein
LTPTRLEPSRAHLPAPRPPIGPGGCHNPEGSPSNLHVPDNLHVIHDHWIYAIGGKTNWGGTKAAHLIARVFTSSLCAADRRCWITVCMPVNNILLVEGVTVGGGANVSSRMSVHFGVSAGSDAFCVNYIDAFCIISEAPLSPTLSQPTSLGEDDPDWLPFSPSSSEGRSPDLGHQPSTSPSFVEVVHCEGKAPMEVGSASGRSSPRCS